MDRILRRGAIGTAAGLIASIALITTLHNLMLGLVLGSVVGAVYSIIIRTTPFAYAESVFTAGTLGIPLWAVFSIIVLPMLGGSGPQWLAEGMRVLFPQFVGWVLYGAGVGLVAQALNDLALRAFGPEPVAQPSEIEKTRIVILSGGFGGMKTAECLEREFGMDASVSFTLVSEGNALLFTPMLAEVAGSVSRRDAAKAPIFSARTAAPIFPSLRARAEERRPFSWGHKWSGLCSPDRPQA